MGDFVYQGEHSITFDPDNLNINTWKKWHMAPKSRPFVMSPPIKEEYVDVPGADGALDYTDALTGKTRYGRRTGQWDFIIDNGYREWTELYSEILMTLHGKKFNIVLDDDPNYFYKGRLTVSGSFGNKDFSGITIAYNLDPYKYPLGMQVVDPWKWNDLFGNTIYFGRFNVGGLKLRVFKNETEEDKIATLTTTNHMEVYDFNNFDDYFSYNGKVTQAYLQAGKNGMDINDARANVLLCSNFDSDACPPTYIYAGDNEVTLKPGDNCFYFKGSGVVTVSYEKGKTL